MDCCYTSQLLNQRNSIISFTSNIPIAFVSPVILPNIYPSFKTILGAFNYLKSIGTKFGTIYLFGNIQEISTLEFNTYLNLIINGDGAIFTGCITIDGSTVNNEDPPFIVWRQMKCNKETNRSNFILKNVYLVFFYDTFFTSGHDIDPSTIEGNIIEIQNASISSGLYIICSLVDIESNISFIESSQTSDPSGLISLQSCFMSGSNPALSKPFFNLNGINLADTGSIIFSYGSLLNAVNCPAIEMISSKLLTFSFQGITLDKSNLTIQGSFLFQLNGSEQATFSVFHNESSGRIANTSLEIYNSNQGYVFVTDESSIVKEGENSYFAITQCSGNHETFPSTGTWN